MSNAALRPIVLPALAFLAALALWQFVVRAFDVPEFLLPAPTAIFRAAVNFGWPLLTVHTLATLQTILLGSAFTAIDTFTISLLYPRTGQDCDAPCGHFDLDSVTLATGPAPVPLPPAAPLMGAAVLGLFALRRRRDA